MIAFSTERPWLEDAAAAAQGRLDALEAALVALVVAVDRLGRATDWQSPTARAFHDDAGRLRDRIGGLRARAAETAEQIAHLRAALAVDRAGGPGAWP